MISAIPIWSKITQPRFFIISASECYLVSTLKRVSKDVISFVLKIVSVEKKWK